MLDDDTLQEVLKRPVENTHEQQEVVKLVREVEQLQKQLQQLDAQYLSTYAATTTSGAGKPNENANEWPVRVGDFAQGIIASLKTDFNKHPELSEIMRDLRQTAGSLPPSS